MSQIKLFVKEEPTKDAQYVLGYRVAEGVLMVLSYINQIEDINAYTDRLPGGLEILGVVESNSVPETYFKGRVRLEVKRSGRDWSWFSVEDGNRMRQRPSKQKRTYEMRRVVGRLSLGEMTMFVKEKDLDMKTYVSNAVRKILEQGTHVFVGTRSERSSVMLSDAADEEEGDVKARFVSTNLRTTLCGNRSGGLRALLTGNLTAIACVPPQMSVKDVAFHLREDICRSVRARLAVHGKNLVLGKDRSRITVALGPRFTNDSDFSSYKSESDFKKQWEVVGESKKFVGVGYTPPSSSSTKEGDTKDDQKEEEATFEIELVDSGDTNDKKKTEVVDKTTTTKPSEPPTDNKLTPTQALIFKYHYVFAILLAVGFASLHLIYNS